MRRPAAVALVLLAPLLLFGADGAKPPADDTAALQAILSSPADPSKFVSGGRIALEPRTYRISDTLLVQRRSVILQGQGVSATDAGGTTLLWVGPPGRPMLRLTQAMHCRIEDLRFAGNSQSRPSAAISFCQMAGDPCPVEGNTARNVWIGPMLGWDKDYARQFDAGILFEGVDENDDFTTFENLTIIQCNVGIKISNPMNCGNDFRNVRLYECDTGVVENSLNTYTNMYQGNCRVNLAVQGGASPTLVGFQSEGAERLCVFDPLGGSLSVRGGRFQAGQKFAADGLAIDGYTPNPVTVSLEDFAFSSLGSGVPTPVVRLRSDPAGSEGRKTFLGRNLVNFSAANLDMQVNGPASRYPDAQRFIDFNRRGMHSSPGSLPGGSFRNVVNAGGVVDLNRFDSPAPPPNPNSITGDLRVGGNLILSGTLYGSALDLGGGRRWTPQGIFLDANKKWTSEGLWMDAKRYWIDDGLYPGQLKWYGVGAILDGPNESVRFVGWEEMPPGSGNRRQGWVVPPLKGK